MRIQGLLLPVLAALTTALAAVPAPQLLILENGNVWVGLPSGLYRYQQENELMSRVRPEGALDLCLDEGVLWMATAAGLHSADLKYLNWKSYGAADGLSSDTVVGAAADLDYVFAAGPGGLSRMDKLVGQWEPFGDFHGRRVHGLYSDKDNLWVATDQGVDHFLKAFQKWEHFGMGQGLLSDNTIRLFYFKGALWAAHERGFSRYNEKMRNWTTFSAKDGLPEADITVMKPEDPFLWVSCGNEVLRFDGEKEAWERFSENTPLTGLAILDIAASGNQAFFATDKGVWSYQQDTRKWALYTEADGLSGRAQDRIFMAPPYALAFRAGGYGVFKPEENLWVKKGLERGSAATAAAGPDLSLLGRASFKMRHKAEIPGPLAENAPDYLFDASRAEREGRYGHFLYWWEKADLNLNADLHNQRNVLGTFNNTDPNGDLRYSAVYSGAPDDAVRSVRFRDTEKTDYFFGTLSDPTYVEGGGASMQFGDRVGAKKRSRANASAWAGGHKTATLTRLVPFQEDNFYFLGVGNIITESVELTVDNEPLDAREYSIERTLGILTFRDESRVNPESRIEISLEYEPDINAFTGEMAVAEQMTVVNDNLAFSASGAFLRKNEPDAPGTGMDENRLTTGSAAAEIEFKSRDGSTLFRAYPELSTSYNDSILVEKKGSAAKIRMNAVADDLRVTASGRAMSDNYESVAENNSIYGRVENEAQARAVYDLTETMPVSASGRAIRARQGGEKSGALEWLYAPPRLPSLRLKALGQDYHYSQSLSGGDSLSRIRTGARAETEWDLPDNLSRSLFLNRAYFNAAYDLDLTGTDSLGLESDQRSHNLYARVRLSPHSRLMLETRQIVRFTDRSLTGGPFEGELKRFRPEYALFSQDLLPGVTLYGRLRFDNLEDRMASDTSGWADRTRFNGSALLSPGAWAGSLDPLQLLLAYSRLKEDSNSTASSADGPGTRHSDTKAIRRGLTQGFTAAPALYFGPDVRFLNRAEFTREKDFGRLSAAGEKVTTDLDFYLRERKTNLLIEYDYTADSTSDSAEGFTAATRHETRFKWTQRWFSWFRTEFRTGASRAWCDTSRVRTRDGFFTNILLDWRNSRFVRELRVQEQFGPIFSNGAGLDFGSYEAALANKLDISVKAGRNLYARLFINVNYSFEENLLKYDMAEFKLLAVF